VAKRWTHGEIARLRDLAAPYSAPEIAEKLDRSVGGVVFKAHQINLSLRARHPGPDAVQVSRDGIARC
jgi:hypothetical protein